MQSVPLITLALISSMQPSKLVFKSTVNWSEYSKFISSSFTQLAKKGKYLFMKKGCMERGKGENVNHQRNSNPKFCKADRKRSRPDKDLANATLLAECSAQSPGIFICCEL